MSSLIDDLLERAADLERQIEAELNARRRQWHYRVFKGRVLFARRARTALSRLRLSIPRYLRDSRPLHLVTAPVIYSLLAPVALLDAWVTAYQWICFPVFGITRVSRSAYVVIDRHRLPYLNGIEKLNCVYCGYANGVFAYVREVAGRTEQFWCPIRHAKRVRAPHPHYRDFVDYGDAEGYQHRLPVLRQALHEPEPKPAVVKTPPA